MYSDVQLVKVSPGKVKDIVFPMSSQRTGDTTLDSFLQLDARALENTTTGD